MLVSAVALVGLGLAVGSLAYLATWGLGAPRKGSRSAWRWPWWERALVGVGSSALVVLFLDGVAVVWALLAGAVVLGAQQLRRAQTERARRRARQEEVREACDVLASELLAGQLPVSALFAAGEVYPPLRQVAEQARWGGDPASALAAVALTPGAEGLADLSRAWSLAVRQGAGLVAAVEQVQQRLLEQAELSRVLASESASAMATARSVAVLPFLGLGLAAGTGVNPVEFLLYHPVGLGALIAGLILLWTGLWWIDRLISGLEKEAC